MASAAVPTTASVAATPDNVHLIRRRGSRLSVVPVRVMCCRSNKGVVRSMASHPQREVAGSSSGNGENDRDFVSRRAKESRAATAPWFQAPLPGRPASGKQSDIQGLVASRERPCWDPGDRPDVPGIDEGARELTVRTMAAGLRGVRWIGGAECCACTIPNCRLSFQCSTEPSPHGEHAGAEEDRREAFHRSPRALAARAQNSRV